MDEERWKQRQEKIEQKDQNTNHKTHRVAENEKPAYK